MKNLIVSLALALAFAFSVQAHAQNNPDNPEPNQLKKITKAIKKIIKKDGQKEGGEFFLFKKLNKEFVFLRGDKSRNGICKIYVSYKKNKKNKEIEIFYKFLDRKKDYTDGILIIIPYKKGGAYCLEEDGEKKREGIVEMLAEVLMLLN